MRLLAVSLLLLISVPAVHAADKAQTPNAADSHQQLKFFEKNVRKKQKKEGKTEPKK